MAQLPTESLWLLEYQQNQDLLNRWLEIKRSGIFLGKCLKARFGGGGGNPAKRALKEGSIDSLQYRAITAQVDGYVGIFAVLQTAWEDIKDAIFCIDGGPKSETELFFEILREQHDRRFQDCVEGFTTTIRKTEQKTKLVRDLIQHHSAIEGKGWDGSLSAEERRKADSLFSQKTCFWFPLAMRLCQDVAEKDIEIKRRLNKVRTDGAHLSSLLLQIAREERSRHPFRRMQSEKWRARQLYVGTVGGFKSVTELNKTNP